MEVNSWKSSTKRELATKSARRTSLAISEIENIYCYIPGTVAPRGIRRYQKNTEIIIRKTPLQRLNREIVKDFKNDLLLPSSEFVANMFPLCSMILYWQNVLESLVLANNFIYVDKRVDTMILEWS